MNAGNFIECIIDRSRGGDFQYIGPRSDETVVRKQGGRFKNKGGGGVAYKGVLTQRLILNKHIVCAKCHETVVP